ncbi:XapX domain-containing protein [Roseomonas sp. JC162]|uniref:XapX domain-containing protein n=1 Tax=Neoroseomonas marina TaxID=1232220 RepID=A0A848ECA0_9PROT|nr:XapX domain-containing protein [Neoroseomonas marina]NMJ41083.1 XapX domain-containing protein [Neoroseomonas marina]
MRLYLAALGAGLLVGVVYSLLQVRSPAPPVVALVGLLGILIGEQVLPVARHLIAGEGLRSALGLAGCSEHLLGRLPGRVARDERAPPS